MSVGCGGLTWCTRSSKSLIAGSSASISYGEPGMKVAFALQSVRMTS
jgi:hypothetical protein